MFARLGHSPSVLLDRALVGDRRVLLFGEPGVGKSTLSTELARALWGRGKDCVCVSADPGTPAFGVPGAISRARWNGSNWEVTDQEGLCTLDAGRFRLPLVAALRRLLDRPTPSGLLIDAPGVDRGLAGAELLPAMVETTRADTVLVLTRSDGRLRLRNELAALPVDVFCLDAAPGGRCPTRQERAEWRTQAWNDYLGNAKERILPLRGLRLIGTPPPKDAPNAWAGRQAALLDDQGRTIVLGEVSRWEADRLAVRMPTHCETHYAALLVRDARRDAEGLLRTAKRPAQGRGLRTPPPDMAAPPEIGLDLEPRPTARVGAAMATLVNGIFGDPLLHVRLRHQKRSLLFDLGEAGRLPARSAHQVTEVFITHAHFDHIAGFLWLLRSRIGHAPTCRLFGPPGLINHVENLLGGIRWDRIGDRGPRFEVAELHGDRLLRATLQAGRTKRPMGEAQTADGLLVDDPGFRVRATTLDHGIPVLAFAFESSRQLNVRKERLMARGLEAGPWLTRLKRTLQQGKRSALIELPNGHSASADSLAKDLILVTPGEKLVYATDLADTAANRTRLVNLARGAHAFFCEAAFAEADAQHAAATGHLTTRACGEIASEAGVTQLMPFHFSRRYETEPERIYEEVRAACSHVGKLL